MDFQAFVQWTDKGVHVLSHMVSCRFGVAPPAVISPLIPHEASFTDLPLPGTNNSKAHKSL